MTHSDNEIASGISLRRDPDRMSLSYVEVMEDIKIKISHTSQENDAQLDILKGKESSIFISIIV